MRRGYVFDGTRAEYVMFLALAQHLAGGAMLRITRDPRPVGRRRHQVHVELLRHFPVLGQHRLAHLLVRHRIGKTDPSLFVEHDGDGADMTLHTLTLD